MSTTVNGPWQIVPVVRDRDFLDMKELCIEFATAIDFELDYQQLLRESASIKDIYKMPRGAGFLLKANSQSIGFIALKKVNYNTVQIQKFYVRPSMAFLKWGNNLLETAVDWAMQSNYQKIWADPGSTYPSLKKLYPESDFRERFVRDETSSQLVKVLEKALVSVPEYFQL
jgi:hypothetical protein